MSLRLNAAFKSMNMPRPGMPVPDLRRAGAPGPSGEPSLLIFATLHCADCIALLPHLAPAAEVLSGYRMYLFMAGDPKEVREVAEYFGWTFPVYPVSIRELHEGMGVQAYPFVLFDIGDGTIARAGTAHDASEIISLSSGLLMKGGD